jgi:AcrR family transcriptional regulator
VARRRSVEQTREQILAAAAELLARDGYDGVNSNQIARAAGVGVGTFYRHFADKRSLADALALKVWEELGRVMPADDVDDPIAFARSATEAILGYAERRPARFRAAFGLGRRARTAPSVRPIERRFQLLAARGAIAQELDLRVAARAWWAMVSGTLVWWLEDPSRAPRERLLETLGHLHPMAVGRTIP